MTTTKASVFHPMSNHAQSPRTTGAGSVQESGPGAEPGVPSAGHLPVADAASKVVRRLPRILALAGVLAIALLAARPLFDPRLIQGADSLPHFYSLVQLDHLVNQGILYSRWFPYKYSGFGGPFFQYYGPLAFYAAEAVARLGLELLPAFRLAWALTLLGAAVGTYLWARDVLDRGPALVAAAAYVCGPYILFNAYFRAGYTEQFALMFMPLTLWAFRRLARTAQVRYLLLASACYAGLTLSHNLTALIFSPWLAAYTLVLALGPEGWRLRWRVLARLWTVIGLGLGLSAFFWLPAFWERGALRTDLATASPAVDFRSHFVHPRRLLVGPLAHLSAPALGLVTVLLAVVGLAATDPTFGGKRQERREVSLAALGAGLCILLALSLSAPLWQALPALRLFQFPFRFLGLASLLLAFVAGFGVRAILSATSARIPGLGRMAAVGLPLIVLVLLVAQTRALSQVGYYKPLPDINVGLVMEKEREAAPFLGEFTGAYIPATVQKPPPREQQALDGPERLDLGSLPANASLGEANYRPLRYDLILRSPEPFLATFRTYYFPGWWAELDGKSVPIAVIDPHGKIGVQVPAGEHHLVVRFGSTPLRTAASALSCFMVFSFVCAAILFSMVKRRDRGEVPMP